MVNVIPSRGYIKATDGTPLPYLYWRSKISTANKVIICVPEPRIKNPYYFSLLAGSLASEGITVYSLNLRGWEEKLTNKKPDLTMQDLVSSFEYFTFIEKEKKIFLLGIGFGCLYCLRFAYEYSEYINGLILLAPSHNPQILEKDETAKPLQTLLTKSIYYAKNLRIPVFIVQGEKDNLTNLNAPKALFDKIGHPNKEIMIFSNTEYQEVDRFFSEENSGSYQKQRYQILEKMFDWIEKER